MNYLDNLLRISPRQHLLHATAERPQAARNQPHQNRVRTVTFSHVSPIPNADMLQFESFEELSLAPFDMDTMMGVYETQYDLVERALFLGSSAQLISDNDDSTEIIELQRLFDRQYEDALHKAIMRKTPGQLRSLVETIMKSCRVGDLIDCTGYRGTGYYLVTSTAASGDEDCVYKCADGKRIVSLSKTHGTFGCHLPAEAWPLIEQFSYSFFEKADVWGCVLPDECRIDSRSNDANIISWLQRTDQVLINGNIYMGELCAMNPK